MYSIKVVFFCIALSMLLCCKTKEDNIQNISEDLPNIILIVADDLGYADMGCAKLANDVSTPNIDRIATSGVRFPQAYQSSPICSVSRVGMITGIYPQRLGSYWYSAEGLHDSKFKTIPELLSQKQYKSGYVGKVHYGDNDSDISNRSFPLNHGFDYYFGHTSARKHYMNHRKEIEEDFLEAKKTYKRKGQTLRQGSLWENYKPVDTTAFLTELIGHHSRAFIERNKESKFFLQIAFNAVHNFTHQLPQKYMDSLKIKGYHDWNPEKEDYYDWYVKGRYPNNKEGRQHYLGQLYYLDREIGKLLDLLETQGLRENTLIVFISDNGGSTPIYANNYPLRGSKYLLYEGGMRTQMLVSYPKKYQKEKVCQNMVSAMDILPSICEATGIEIPNYVDGISLDALLRGKDKGIHHEVLYWDTGYEMAVRKENWKLHKSFNDEEAKYEMVELELGEFLIDLDNDLEEKFNVINEETKIKRELNDLYLGWKAYVAN
ncbi:sulfatase-like hydrolase/transferase [Sabulilitoribacter arenilitoris]|uniref:Sulfatase-like hydrolase/transferase n=1 Tax=Wocania arenilitoris TaxID=2044858 RepID=A0AAE3EMP1_9FLAO|nr:sulfatase-like hydrolase/transferase [Wocania arenilitoris]MCF7567059.1 sulfatase-like hydrolase/transferase [Wocania arenilitoris]